ncbi:MAG: hypothetical protein J7480_09385, partial [Microbacteriaceae bacterium]|nr:hypothetical protein [Microbacteriaceae bacterium]
GQTAPTAAVAEDFVAGAPAAAPGRSPAMPTAPARPDGVVPTETQAPGAPREDRQAGTGSGTGTGGGSGPGTSGPKSPTTPPVVPGGGADPGSGDPASGGEDPGSPEEPPAEEPPVEEPPVEEPAPVVPTLSASLTIDAAGNLLTGGKSVGTVTVSAQNIGPVSLGGTLSVSLPSGVQYDDGGLIGQLLGIVSSLLTSGAIQTCSPASSTVVCSVVGLLPGASTSVSIPVTIAQSGAGGSPSASFSLL